MHLYGKNLLFRQNVTSGSRRFLLRVTVSASLCCHGVWFVLRIVPHGTVHVDFGHVLNVFVFSASDFMSCIFARSSVVQFFLKTRFPLEMSATGSCWFPLEISLYSAVVVWFFNGCWKSPQDWNWDLPSSRSWNILQFLKLELPVFSVLKNTPILEIVTSCVLGLVVYSDSWNWDFLCSRSWNILPIPQIGTFRVLGLVVYSDSWIWDFLCPRSFRILRFLKLGLSV